MLEHQPTSAIREVFSRWRKSHSAAAWHRCPRLGRARAGLSGRMDGMPPKLAQTKRIAACG